jgi:hypothetical protein
MLWIFNQIQGRFISDPVQYDIFTVISFAAVDFYPQ